MDSLLSFAHPTPSALGNMSSSHCAGYLMLAEKLYLDGTEYTGAWNFGP
jgi:hypothetical protein